MGPECCRRKFAFIGEVRHDNDDFRWSKIALSHLRDGSLIAHKEAIKARELKLLEYAFMEEILAPAAFGRRYDPQLCSLFGRWGDSADRDQTAVLAGHRPL